MKRILSLLIITLALPISALAQQKVAILETVDKAQNVSYGVKLLLRSSLTAAISNTPGYEGYDRVDMASIAGEQEFQRTGNVSDSQIKQIGIAAGASYVLVAEAARYDATSIIITAKILDVETFGVKSSAVLVSGISADEMQQCCNTLAAKLLHTTPPQAPISQPVVQNTLPTQPIQNVVQSQAPSLEPAAGEVGSVIVFSDNTRGIVFYKDSGKGLAVSLYATELQWHTTTRKKEMIDVPQIPNNEDDDRNFTAGIGEMYTNAIISNLGNGTSPAAEWCIRQGSGWYLPSAGELVYLFKIANDKERGSIIDAGLMRAGGAKLEGGWYWSSSEANLKEAINVSASGTGSSEEKKNTEKVRAIRAFSY